MLTVALLQLYPPGHEQTANYDKGVRACRTAKSMGADIALFPEMWNVGYTLALPEESSTVYGPPESWPPKGKIPPTTQPPTIWRDLTITTDGPFVSGFRVLAAELDMAIALTYVERTDGSPRNSVALIDRHGEIVLSYAKVHTCAFSPYESTLQPGDRFDVCTVDTAAGPVMVGAMICYDREFPESARSLMLAGAELILTPNACDLEINRIAQFRARAAENMVAVAMANYPGPGWGHSLAFDGIAFSDGRSRDMLAVEAGERAGIYPAIFDIDALREYRRRETWGDAFRRPSTYAALVDKRVREPFVRVDRHGRPPAR